MNNQQSYWYTAQVVTASQMMNFSQDLYARITFMTQTQAPCILSIGAISQTSGDVSLAAGSFRFADATYAYLPYNTGIIGNAPAAVVAVTGNGYIVARYTVMPTSMNQTNYSYPTQYLFITGSPTATDCVVCTITSGVISGYGTFFNYLPDFVDDVFNSRVIITGSNGLLVNNNFQVNGTFAAPGMPSYFQDSATGAQIIVTRDAGTEPGFALYLKAEDTSTGVAGGTGNPWSLSGQGGTGEVTLCGSYNSTDGRTYNPTATAQTVTEAKAQLINGDLPGDISGASINQGFPNGSNFEMGSQVVTFTAGVGTITFSTAFATACLSAIAISNNAANPIIAVSSFTTTTFNVTASGAFTGSATISYMAAGN